MSAPKYMFGAKMIKQKVCTLSSLRLEIIYTVFTLSIWTDWPVHYNVVPDQMPKNVVFDLGLHCLLLIQQYLKYQQEVKWTCSNFRKTCVKC